jgi:hypothetical protein
MGRILPLVAVAVAVTAAVLKKRKVVPNGCNNACSYRHEMADTLKY